MSKDKDSNLLYQDLPSIPPRVSRSERLSLQRKKTCRDCLPNSLEKAKRSSRHLYFFYIVLLAIGILATQLYQRFHRTDSSISPPLESKTISVSFSQKIVATLINRENRYGLSLLFRNNSNHIWEINQFTIILPNSEKKISLNQKVKQKSFYTIFVPLEKENFTINNISIVIPN